MDQFINQPVLNWAQQYLPQPVEVKVKDHKILLAVCFAILGLIFGGIALLFYVTAISTLVKSGWSQQVAAPLIGGTFMLFVLVAIVGGLLLLGKLTRRNFAKCMSANGVQTRSGRTYDWSNLHYLDYKKVHHARGSLRGAGLAGRVVSGAVTSAAQAAIFAGHEKVTVEMVFANGKAVVPPLIHNQPEILGLLNSMPVQRRKEGSPMQ
jgi:hypothetical protein